jgi:hypothetical protein
MLKELLITVIALTYFRCDWCRPTGVPPGLENVPFAPFSKMDKLGRASDWTSNNFPRVQAGALKECTFRGFFAFDNGRGFELMQVAMASPTYSISQWITRYAFEALIEDGNEINEVFTSVFLSTFASCSPTVRSLLCRIATFILLTAGQQGRRIWDSGACTCSISVMLIRMIIEH